MQETNSNERLTWDEIVKKYPHKWVGIADAKREEGNICSGIVKYVDDTDSEIFMRQITIGDVVAEYTTPDELWANLPFGALTCFPD